VTRKTLHVLVAIITGLVLLLVVLRSNDLDDVALSGTPLLPGFANVANDMDKVDLSRPPGEEGVTLHKTGDTWVVGARHDYPANLAKLRRLVIALADAEIVVNTTVVAMHPNATWADVKAGAKPGGAITVSIALVNGAGGDVMIRSVDTKSTDDIWAFHQVENDDPGINLIFRSWGNSIRRGMLQLQGRTNDPLAPVIQVKQQ